MVYSVINGWWAGKPPSFRRCFWRLGSQFHNSLYVYEYLVVWIPWCCLSPVIDRRPVQGDPASHPTYVAVKIILIIRTSSRNMRNKHFDSQFFLKSSQETFYWLQNDTDFWTWCMKLADRKHGASPPHVPTNRAAVVINKAEIPSIYLLEKQCNARRKIDASCAQFLLPSGLQVKRTLAVTVSILSQFPGTSRQEWCCLSTINNSGNGRNHSDCC